MKFNSGAFAPANRLAREGGASQDKVWLHPEAFRPGRSPKTKAKDNNSKTEIQITEIRTEKEKSENHTNEKSETKKIQI